MELQLLMLLAFCSYTDVFICDAASLQDNSKNTIAAAAVLI